jgi:hypothetical protein
MIYLPTAGAYATFGSKAVVGDTATLREKPMRWLSAIELQPYATSVLCPTSIIYPSGSRM